MTVAARVYDLDGTLVRLDVDWAAADAAVVEAVRGAGRSVDNGVDVWTLLEDVDDDPVAATVHEILAVHERAGAERSIRLPAADDLESLDGPVAVCSLNCEAACRIALDRHDLSGHVHAVVGRDTVDARKPDPKPLLAAVRALEATPGETLFIGDSERDALTAERAGTQFAYVGDGPSDH